MKTKIQLVTLLSLSVAACGGSGSAPDPVNAAPTISAIADQNTVANAPSAAITFTVVDEDPASLIFDVTSDNQDVFPDADLSIDIDGRTGSLTTTPVIDTLGDAFISIVVTDAGGRSANSSFLLTVTPESASVQQFVRAEFAKPDDGDPALVNAIAFEQDADNDDFADLLIQ